LTTTVAQLRRDAPGKAAKIYAANLREVLEKEDEEFELQQERQQRRKRRRLREEDKDGDEDMNMEGQDDDMEDIDPEFRLDIPFGTQAERERWQSGEMAEVYTDTLRTLLRLQGEELTDSNSHDDDDSDKKAISTTVATAERAEKAVDVVERMV
jgi:kinetochor protein Mis14/NSL1